MVTCSRLVVFASNRSCLIRKVALFLAGIKNFKVEIAIIDNFLGIEVDVNTDLNSLHLRQVEMSRTALKIIVFCCEGVCSEGSAQR